MTSDRKTLIAAIIIFMALLIFAFLDIGAYSSNTATDSSVSSYSSGNATSPLSGDVVLYVSREDAFDVIVGKEMVRELENLGYSVILTDELKDDYGSQFAFVNVLDVRMLYTPVYASSEADVTFGYSSSGKTGFLDIEGSDNRKAVVFSSASAHDYQLLVQGNMVFHDETKGLFTYKSYQHHLAGEFASSVAVSLDSHIRAGQ